MLVVTCTINWKRDFSQLNGALYLIVKMEVIKLKLYIERVTFLSLFQLETSNNKLKI